MKDSENGYHISFFKPTTERARFNRNLVVWLASIWFIAIFGFQITLRVIGKPTPEPAFITYEKVWEQVKSGGASDAEIQEFGQAILMVLGKVAIEPGERAVLDNAFSWSVYSLVPDTMQAALVSEISEFTALREAATNIADEQYVKSKMLLSKKLSPVIGISELDARTRILPLELVTENIEILTEETIEKLPSIMQKYLIHNQSVLTDTVFLGFPFHYFYTAVFLLILFVVLCWLYCIRTDARDVILGIKE